MDNSSGIDFRFKFSLHFKQLLCDADRRLNSNDKPPSKEREIHGQSEFRVR